MDKLKDLAGKASGGGGENKPASGGQEDYLDKGTSLRLSFSFSLPAIVVFMLCFSCCFGLVYEALLRFSLLRHTTSSSYHYYYYSVHNFHHSILFLKKKPLMTRALVPQLLIPRFSPHGSNVLMRTFC